MSRSAWFLLPALLVVVGCGPLGPLSGGSLRGETAPLPTSWQDRAEVENAQLETNPADPHSINIWWVSVDDSPFVSTSLILGPEDPKERTWVKNVEANPDVRLRVGKTVFEARLEKLADPAVRARVLASMAEKYGELSPERTPTAWIYRVVAR